MATSTLTSFCRISSLTTVLVSTLSSLNTQNVIPTLSTTPAVPVVPAPTSTPALNVTSEVIPITPHDKWDASTGAVGCLMNINRFAYWPTFPACDNLCFKVTHDSGRYEYVIHLDSSGGAHDISYETWNYLVSGYSVSEHPVCGGAVNMQREAVPFEHCQDIIQTDDGTLPFIAKSTNWPHGCRDTWIWEHMSWWNFAKQDCSLGIKERCDTYDWSIGENQPKCPSGFNQDENLMDKITDVPYDTSKCSEENSLP